MDKTVVDILMRRDGMSRFQAKELIEDCRNEIDDVLAHGGDYDEVVDILKDWLGLEPDYLDYII